MSPAQIPQQLCELLFSMKDVLLALIVVIGCINLLILVVIVETHTIKTILQVLHRLEPRSKSRAQPKVGIEPPIDEY